jgi:dTMP kinase
VSQTGHFISLEGGEGVGKSTQVRALAEALQKRGIDVLVTREPGGSDGAEVIRNLLLGGEDERWGADRFVDSSLAYQGGAGGLGIEAVRAINAFAIEGWFPSRTLVLTLDEGGERARARDTDGSDRIGGRSGDYHRKVDTAFRIIAAEEPERVKLVDASGTPEQVTERLLDAIADLLP